MYKHTKTNLGTKCTIDLIKWYESKQLNIQYDFYSFLSHILKDNNDHKNKRNNKIKSLSEKDFDYTYVSKTPEILKFQSTFTFLNGKWGSGKTSFVESLMEKFDNKSIYFINKEQSKIVYDNVYSINKIDLLELTNHKDYKELLVSYVIDQIISKWNRKPSTKENIINAISKITKAISIPLKVFRKTADLSNALDKASKQLDSFLIENSNEINEVIKEFNKENQLNDFPISIIFIDNIERLSSKKAKEVVVFLSVLSSISSFSFIFNTNDFKFIENETVKENQYTSVYDLSQNLINDELHNLIYKYKNVETWFTITNNIYDVLELTSVPQKYKDFSKEVVFNFKNKFNLHDANITRRQITNNFNFFIDTIDDLFNLIKKILENISEYSVSEKEIDNYIYAMFFDYFISGNNWNFGSFYYNNSYAVDQVNFSFKIPINYIIALNLPTNNSQHYFSDYFNTIFIYPDFENAEYSENNLKIIESIYEEQVSEIILDLLETDYRNETEEKTFYDYKTVESDNEIINYIYTDFKLNSNNIRAKLFFTNDSMEIKNGILVKNQDPYDFFNFLNDFSNRYPGPNIKVPFNNMPYRIMFDEFLENLNKEIKVLSNTKSHFLYINKNIDKSLIAREMIRIYLKEDFDNE